MGLDDVRDPVRSTGRQPPPVRGTGRGSGYGRCRRSRRGAAGQPAWTTTWRTASVSTAGGTSSSRLPTQSRARSRSPERGAIGVRGDNLNMVPTPSQGDGGLGYQNCRAAEPRRQPGDDLEDPHKGARINSALGRTTGNIPGPRRSWQCVGDKGERRVRVVRSSPRCRATHRRGHCRGRPSRRLTTRGIVGGHHRTIMRGVCPNRSIPIPCGGSHRRAVEPT